MNKVKVIVCTDFEATSSIRTANLIRTTELTSDVYINNEEVATFYNYSIFPIEYLEDLVSIVCHRQELKKALDDSIKLVYQLRNKITNEKL
jgi:hypothetical protein